MNQGVSSSPNLELHHNFRFVTHTLTSTLTRNVTHNSHVSKWCVNSTSYSSHCDIVSFAMCTNVKGSTEKWLIVLFALHHLACQIMCLVSVLSTCFFLTDCNLKAFFHRESCNYISWIISLVKWKWIGYNACSEWGTILFGMFDSHDDLATTKSLGKSI